MGIGTGILLIAVGAILRFAVDVETEGFNLQTIGVILICAGVATSLLSMVFWQSWGGFGGGRTGRQTVITERDAP